MFPVVFHEVGWILQEGVGIEELGGDPLTSQDAGWPSPSEWRKTTLLYVNLHLCDCYWMGSRSNCFRRIELSTGVVKFHQMKICVSLEKKWQPIFFGRENETSFWIGFAWGGWNQKSKKKHVPTLHGDEETSIFSETGWKLSKFSWLYRFHFFNFPGEWATMTPPYAGTLVGSGSACHLAISER